MTPAAGATLNPRLQEIVDDFHGVPDRDRLQLLLEFSQDLPALPERYAEHRDRMEPVPECQTPLFLAVEVEPDETVHLYFDAPPEFSGQLGLSDLVSPLRLRGMAAMLSRIKRQVSRLRAAPPAAP